MSNGMVRMVVFGMGNRARKYLRHMVALEDVVEVVAVVERDALRLAEGKSEFCFVSEICYPSVDAFFTSGVQADAALVATPDDSHFGIAMRALGSGMALLLEKPMAVTEDQCLSLVSAASASSRPAGLCYVLRYHPYYNRLRELSTLSGLGRIVSVHHKVVVGVDRMTHTFVRGLWSRSEDSSPIFLSKCCHDVDWLFSLVGLTDISEIETVDSKGSLSRYCAGSAPSGSALRCIDCPLESSCRYSAVDLYCRRGEWTGNFIPAEGETRNEVIERELREGKFGRCVYHCDNDVEDFRRAVFRLKSGVTIDVTMDGIADADGRETVIEFEHGRIEASYGRIDVILDGNFPLSLPSLPTSSPVVRTQDSFSLGSLSWQTASEDWTAVCRQPFHAGADFAIVDDFLSAVRTGAPMRSPLSSALPATLACLRASSR